MSAWNPAGDIPNLQGKIAVVTGARYARIHDTLRATILTSYSVGIGFQIVRHLAQHGAKVYATTRSMESATRAQGHLSSHTGIPPGAVEWLQMDLADLKSITETAKEISRRADRLDILVNNAATITASLEIVAGRWEKNMAVNVLGPLLFINRLIPKLESTSKLPGADVRIVTVASTAPLAFLPANFTFRFDSIAGLQSPVATYPASYRYFTKFLFASDMILYSVSKAGVIIYASKLQQLLDERGLDIMSLIVHPGEVATEGVAEANNMFLRTMARAFFVTSEQGAVSPLFAATARQVRDDPDQYKNKLLLPVGKPSALHPVVDDQKQSQGLWDIMTKELARHLSAEGLAPMQAW
ncbi:Short-chain dehydrogenase/reductase [Paramyrothecium foliicola]|nr:Short-chain dehydrogenase/reductase [Paramyrothecium foliicola]